MNKSDISKEYRNLPSVDELLRDERVAEILQLHPRKLVVESIRTAIEQARESIAVGGSAPDSDVLIGSVKQIMDKLQRRSLRRVVNATGVILHTGLGRAVLCKQAQEAVAEVAGGHSNLEVDIASGKRSSRQDHVNSLLMDISGAESALVVNNNAAAVLLAINTLALGKEVIISRSQLVEIGGSFRLPDIIARAGAKMVEVGTTNRTRISDYEKAITEDTALILRCHPSNFKIVGFTEEASLDELVNLGKKSSIPVMDDLGSGAFVDVSEFGLEHEPTVQDSVSAGAGIITFSGDKLLGASQAGILVGDSDIIDLCKSNPLARALRIDKLSLAALEATLRIYRYGDPTSEISTLASISRPLAEIEAQAKNLVRKINTLHVDGLVASVVRVDSETGGGSLPGQSLESCAVALKSGLLSAEDLGKQFRESETPIFGRINKDTFLLDMRNVSLQETLDILACVRSL